jgi:two-component system phosphate regulon sensor histidine kinase PhoR
MALVSADTSGSNMTRRSLFQISQGPEFVTVLLIPFAGLAAYFVSGSAAAVAITVLLTSPVAILALWMRAIGRADEIARLTRDHQLELNQNQNRLQTLQLEAVQANTALSKMRDGVVMISRPGEILLINPAACRLLNLADQQNYVGRPFYDVVRIPELAQAVAQVGSENESQKLILEVSAEEKLCPIQFQIDQVTPGDDGSLLMTLRDETEARRVDEMRREFVANISHELKTPLAAIKGYAETVELAISDDPQTAVQFMSRINTQCLRLERLISDMMQLARAQAGRENLNFGTVLISDVIAESMKSYCPIAKSKQVELVVDDDLVGAIYGDAEATLTIANNLIGNAIHYTPSGGKVTVSCRTDGSSLALVVADTGVGIDEKEQKRIFERFYRVERNRDSSGGGTGIGLSMVKNLVNTMDGEVRVASKPGEGSTFEVLLPRSDG